jgi:prevent-host-death family protein
VKEVPLAEVKGDFSRYLKEAAAREIVITRHGKPAGVLIGFQSEDDWLEYRLENDPRFLKRIARLVRGFALAAASLLKTWWSKRCVLTIVGGIRERWVVTRRGHGKTVCARGA